MSWPVDLELAHRLARQKGTNMVAYWVVRSILQPFFHLYFRLQRIGREHIPAAGPTIVAANHRSFCDPFLIGVCTRRPLRFVAKAELFGSPIVARILIWLGAFPIRRGETDRQAMETARAILEQGGVVAIFPEGTRMRPGPLGRPRSGVGRLALEAGAQVVPVAIAGTDEIRDGWRVRPRKVRIRCGRALGFPRFEQPGVGMAREATARIWPCVALQWEWLGGEPPLRRAAVVGGARTGTSLAATELLTRAGLSVDVLESPPAAVAAPAGADAVPDLDLLFLAVPARSAAGLVERVRGRAAGDAAVVTLTPEPVVASRDRALRRTLAQTLGEAGACRSTGDLEAAAAALVPAAGEADPVALLAVRPEQWREAEVRALAA